MVLKERMRITKFKSNLPANVFYCRKVKILPERILIHVICRKHIETIIFVKSKITDG